MRYLIVGLTLLVFLAGCDSGEPLPSDSAERLPPPAMSEDQAYLWNGSCAQCHITGVGGAPVMGDSQAWQGRLAKGKKVLLEHTVAGYNNMPPLGYCMACEESDFVVMIENMAGVRLTQ